MKLNTWCAAIAGVFLYQCVALPCGFGADLVAHYEFEDPDNLGADSSGMGNHALTVTNITQVEGQIGQAASFDETLGSAITKSGGLAGYTGVPGRTFAAWVNLSPAATAFDGIISQDAGSCCNNRLLLRDGGTPYINIGEHVDKNMGAPAVPESTWTHIAMVGENLGGGAVGRVYINGVLHAAGEQNFSVMGDASTLNTYLGTGESGSAHRFTGALDDVRIYEGALTVEEIQDIMNPPTTPLQITDFVYDADADTFRVTWNSRPGKEYTLHWSPDFADFSADVDDGIPSQGDTTTFPALDQPARASPIPGARKIFFRVRENP